MVINKHSKFQTDLQLILEYIAKDNLTAAKKFNKELVKQIKAIPDFPYKYCPSKYIDDKQVRDMTFRSYTIVYRIVNNNTIDLITIFNQNLPLLDSED